MAHRKVTGLSQRSAWVYIQEYLQSVLLPLSFIFDAASGGINVVTERIL